MTKLNADRVHAILLDVLFKPEEIPAGGATPSNAVIVEGVLGPFGFHKERLERHRAEVIDMLWELPEQFHDRPHGGWSFLNLCTTRGGEQWTGEHQTMNELCCLAMGLNVARWALPRELWAVLPGSMPYLVLRLPDRQHNPPAP